MQLEVGQGPRIRLATRVIELVLLLSIVHCSGMLTKEKSSYTSRAEPLQWIGNFVLKGDRGCRCVSPVFT